MQTIVNLEQNIIQYKENDAKIKELEKEQQKLKIINLALMKGLKIKNHIYKTFQIQLIDSAKKKIGVNENKLIDLIGEQRVNSLKKVPIDAIVTGINEKTIPEAALDCIITTPIPEYVMIRTLKETKEPVNLSE